MAHPILMPKPGQMTEECVVVAWHKQEGDSVRRGDVLFEIETDKTNMDVEAFDEGVLLKRYVEAGDTVPVNALCAYVGEPGETVPDTARPPATAVPAAAGPHSAVTLAVAPAAVSPSIPSDRLRISPLAGRLAAESGIDPRSITGTGPDGRITEKDVRSALEGAAAALSWDEAQPPSPTAVSPSFRPAPPTGGDAEGEAPQPLSRMRRIIAERLTLSATTVPQFTITVAVDMTRVVTLRAELRSANTQLTVTDFIVSAVAQTLVEFPLVNSQTDGVSVWPRRRIDVGLAVSVPDGLVVPVIRDADHLSLAGIHVRAAELADAARKGVLTPDEMTGSTFTISNLGMFGVEEFSAIINPGESAILAVSSVIATPIVVGDGIGIRQVMKLTLTADHRLVDGELAARFLNSLRRRLEDAATFRGDTLNS